MNHWLERTELLLSEDIIKYFKNSNVLVVGVGGVGAYAAEMIARAGIGNITIIDADIVSITNCNRQLIAMHSTIGRDKVDVLGDRLTDINPELNLIKIKEYIHDNIIDTILDAQKYDYIVDAIDTLTPKVQLIEGALKRGYPLVSSMGAGSKLDPTLVEVKDISKTHHCPLAHMLRKRLSKIGIKKGFDAVFSAEPPIEGSMILCEEQNKKSNVGTISYIPAVFGCTCASVVVRQLQKKLNNR